MVTEFTDFDGDVLEIHLPNEDERDSGAVVVLQANDERDGESAAIALSRSDAVIRQACCWVTSRRHMPSLNQSQAAKPPARVTLSVTREVVVLGVDEKPALSLTLTGEEVKVTPMPRNGTKREPVALRDLTEAVSRLTNP